MEIAVLRAVAYEIDEEVEGYAGDGCIEYFLGSLHVVLAAIDEIQDHADQRDDERADDGQAAGVVAQDAAACAAVAARVEVGERPAALLTLLLLLLGAGVAVPVEIRLGREASVATVGLAAEAAVVPGIEAAASCKAAAAVGAELIVAGNGFSAFWTSDSHKAWMLFPQNYKKNSFQMPPPSLNSGTVTALLCSSLVPGGTSWVSQMLPPIIESWPMVTRPRIEVLE